MKSHSGIIDVGGATLAYEEAGDGPPLVLLHGFSLDSRMWEPQVEAFAQHFRTIRYDLRGFGCSSPPVEGQRYSHEEDLASLLGHLDVHSATLCGMSMGGGVALDFALCHPGSVSALVLEDSVLGGYRWTEEESNLQRAVYRLARQSGMEEARRLWLRDPLFAQTMSQPESAARLSGMVSAYSGWHWVHRDPHVALHPPAVERLAEVGVPALVVVGDLDIPDMQEMAAALHAGIRGSQKAAVPGAGHLPNLERTEEFNDRVLEFLLEIAGAP